MSSRVISGPDVNGHASRLISAMIMADDQVPENPGRPDGLFGRVVQIETGGVLLTNETLDLEFNIPFDDDTEANEAEIVVYNLTQSTISHIHTKAAITITAGYTGDTGVVFSGVISKVKTQWNNLDRVTTIYAIDSQKLEEREITSKSYKKGTKASKILRDLVNQVDLPLAVFSTKRDHTYKDKVTVSGDLMDNIRNFATVCGVSAYILKGKIYVRHVTDGDNIRFVVNEGTGLIGAPIEFEEEVTAEDFKDTIKGYECTMLLQHRITTAAIIDLQSKDANGTFRVRSGEHICNESEFVTRMEVIHTS